MNEKKLGAALDDVARQCVEKPLPASEMLHRNMVEDLIAGTGEKCRFAVAGAGFTELIERVMPAHLVARYIEHWCDTKDAPTDAMEGALTICPIWETSPAFAHGAPAEDRARSSAKFRESEVREYLEFCNTCPMLPLSVLYLKEMMASYLFVVRDRMPAEAKARRTLEHLHQHVKYGKNSARLLPMALYMHLTPEAKATGDIECLDVRASFDFLRRSRAFHGQFYGPLEPDIGIHCPADKFMGQVCVDHGALDTIFNAMTGKRAGTNPGFTAMADMHASFMGLSLTGLHMAVDTMGVEGVKAAVSMAPSIEYPKPGEE